MDSSSVRNPLTNRELKSLATVGFTETGTPAFKAVFVNEKHGVWLYHADCFPFMDSLIEQYPNGIFDMIFADPPYFLSNGGITCHSGKMVSVDKGGWDKSRGYEQNHEFNRAWLSRCQ
jgi:site-specific DNA-methyltransferase (adenine-specific)